MSKINTPSSNEDLPLSLYLGLESVASPSGAAGALMLILRWVHDSSLQILLFGAEFTAADARRR